MNCDKKIKYYFHIHLESVDLALNANKTILQYILNEQLTHIFFYSELGDVSWEVTDILMCCKAEAQHGDKIKTTWKQ